VAWVNSDFSPTMHSTEAILIANTARVRAATPMIHVADVRATAAWYEAIGFTVSATYDDGGDGLSFAILSAGSTRVMFNQGGRPSAERRREVDLYVDVEEVDELFAAIKDRVDVVKAPHDTHYVMRELIIRDLNRFWITFGKSLRAS
jgi:predicted lactoylglutathione lyase